MSILKEISCVVFAHAIHITVVFQIAQPVFQVYDVCCFTQIDLFLTLEAVSKPIFDRFEHD
jgi:hypothetical protein